MFVGKTGAYPIELPFICSTLGQASGLTPKQLDLLEKVVRDKNYEQKSF